MHERSSLQAVLPAHEAADGPSPALGGAGLLATVRRGFLATRPPFFAASAMPVLVGTAWAAARGHHHFDPGLFSLALAATVLAHAATNVFNDVGDDVIGADAGNIGRIYPYTGGSGFIEAGLLSRVQLGWLALGLAVAAIGLGAFLAVLRGPGVIVLGTLGLLLGLLYSLPRVQLSARGVGELAVATGLGVLPVLGAVWLQDGTIDAGAIAVCLPVSAWVGAILIINEVPDVEADRRAGKRTLVVRWGAPGARLLYALLTALALGANLVAVFAFGLPKSYALVALALGAAAAGSLRGISTRLRGRRQLRKSIERTLAIHAIGCVALLTAILV
jgi:1,4-dihydroxy-2-naphthoate octaprenyltransferase